MPEWAREAKDHIVALNKAPEENSELVARMTAAMREADKAHESVGGGARHHVRECLLPILRRHGLALVVMPNTEAREPEPSGPARNGGTQSGSL